MSDPKSEIVVRGPADGERLYAGGDLYRFLAVKKETGGSSDLHFDTKHAIDKIKLKVTSRVGYGRIDSF